MNAMNCPVVLCAKSLEKFDRPMWGHNVRETIKDAWSVTRMVQQTAIDLFYNRKTVTFEENNKTFIVDTETRKIPDLQMEPAVSYWSPLPFVSIAEDIESGEEVFCEIFTKDHGWIQAPLATGKKVIDEVENDM